MRLLVEDGNRNGPFRALSVDQVAEIRRLRRQGVRVATIALRYGVTARTVYRYLKGVTLPVNVSGWRADFVVAPGRIPRQVTPWVPE